MNATAPFVPKRKKLLTRPVLKFVKEVTRYVKFEGAIYVGKEMQSKRGGNTDDKKKEPAHLADVIDLETGEQAQIIINAVPMSVLQESYPNDTYVGKCFAITRQARQEGKMYDPFKVEEIEDPTEAGKAEKPDSTSAQTPAASARPIGGRR